MAAFASGMHVRQGAHDMLQKHIGYAAETYRCRRRIGVGRL